jgi:DNA-binding transcriptional MerR regulator|tara:strand:+ start:613 stop:1005 length:393 start_codon:yes stop_codon:yes gene_type:complete
MLKNNKLLSISKVALKFGLVNPKNQKPLTHTLRFWETKFKQLKPNILAGGRRYYSEKDIEVVKMIFFLLKDRGLTINGAKKVMNENLKKLDATKPSSIKAEYYKNKIKNKSKEILNKLKKLHGKKNTYKS